MAQETVNPRLVKSNIDLLTRITKKPNMATEKLLARPPFKFLHDLTTLVWRGERERAVGDVSKQYETKMFSDACYDFF